ncbi:MAG: DPP IV N-terminal domain-containing protein [Dysgonamonadaceae bacterium]|jgi:dipeptidyl-peptidase-4|nr:DPP IV N-terminal domain-containing protein [Dysgonamonadaceae bacterium]
MKRLFIILLSSSLLISGLQAQTEKRDITLEDIVSGKFRPKKIASLQSLPDGEHYSMLSEDRSAILKYAYKTGKVVDTLFSVKKARECTIRTIDGYQISSTGFRIIVWTNTEPIYRRSRKVDVYDYNVRRNLIKPLSDQAGKLMLPTFSPDGRMCAYIRDNNIWLKKFDYDTESPITKDGSPGKILNGLGSWVYEEEFKAVNLMSWSPDSKVLAFIKSDETDVPSFDLQRFNESLYPTLQSYKYPKAGEKNATVSVHAYNVDTKDVKKMDLPVASDNYIPMIKFTTQPDQLAVMVLNRQQNVFRMYYANPHSTVAKLILKEESSSYIDPDWLNAIHFTESNFTYVSESDGYAHIYLYSPTGVLQRQVTSGSWNVTDFLGIHPLNLTIYYESAEESPLQRSVYSIDSKGKKTKLSSEQGFNQARFNSNFTYYIGNYSSAGVPDKTGIYNKDGKELAVLSDNKPLQSSLASYKISPKEFFTVTNPEGYELNAWMMKPADFDASKKYPVVMVQYSGPGSQSVLDEFEMGWEQYLANQGFIVACVDGRGTGVRSAAFQKCTYLNMGILESDDQIASAQWMGNLPFVDKNRIAIWGWSYGGTITLLSMSRGNGTFKAGIAIAPVTDWHLYDTAYTERYLRTPNENSNGYKQASPVTYADQLQGKLLLIHGTADDNVHFQNTLRYSDALVKAGKQFDMQIYADKDHSISEKETRLHLYSKCCKFLKENL